MGFLIHNPLVKICFIALLLLSKPWASQGNFNTELMQAVKARSSSAIHIPFAPITPSQRAQSYERQGLLSELGIAVGIIASSPPRKEIIIPKSKSEEQVRGILAPILIELKSKIKASGERQVPMLSKPTDLKIEPMDDAYAPLHSPGFTLEFFKRLPEFERRMEIQKHRNVIWNSMTDKRLFSMIKMSDEEIKDIKWATANEREREIFDEDIAGAFISMREHIKKDYDLEQMLNHGDDSLIVGLFLSSFQQQKEKLRREDQPLKQKFNFLTGPARGELLCSIRQVAQDWQVSALKDMYAYATLENFPLLKLFAHVDLNLPVRSALTQTDLFIRVVNAYKQKYGSLQADLEENHLGFVDALADFSEGLRSISYEFLSPEESGSVTRGLRNQVLSEAIVLALKNFKKSHTFGYLSWLDLDFQDAIDQNLAPARMKLDQQKFWVVTHLSMMKPQNFVTSIGFDLPHVIHRVHRTKLSLTDRDVKETLRDLTVDADASLKAPVESWENETPQDNQPVICDASVVLPFLNSAHLRHDLIEDIAKKTKKNFSSEVYVMQQAALSEKSSDQKVKRIQNTVLNPSPDQLVFSGFKLADRGYTVTDEQYTFTLSSNSAGFVLVNDRAENPAEKTLRAFNIYRSNISRGFVQTASSKPEKDEEQLIEIERQYYLSEEIAQ